MNAYLNEPNAPKTNKCQAVGVIMYLTNSMCAILDIFDDLIMLYVFLWRPLEHGSRLSCLGLSIACVVGIHAAVTLGLGSVTIPIVCVILLLWIFLGHALWAGFDMGPIEVTVSRVNSKGSTTGSTAASEQDVNSCNGVVPSAKEAREAAERLGNNLGSLGNNLEKGEGASMFARDALD